jgi:hypothetical protein
VAGQTKYVTWSGGPDGDYICTGSHDEGPINSALAWANANPGNIIKMRGSGNASSPHKYHIEGPVRVGSSTVWTAEVGACLWVPNGACGSSVNNCVFPNGTPVIGQIGSYVTWIEIYGFEIDGNCQNQSTKLGYAHGVLHSAGSGVERLIQLRGLSGSQTKASDIYIHDMNCHDAFGEFVHIMYAKKVRVKSNLSGNHQHENVMLIEVFGDGNEVSDNIMYGITSDCLRLDNCQNISVHDNSFLAYDGPNNNTATKFGHSCMQIANEANKNLQTENITVYNNYFEGKSLAGIWINDQLKTAGSTPQNVYIHHNRFSNNIGWADWAYWSSGINIGPWGNGVRIEYNTFDGCYGNTIQCNNAINSNATHTIIVKNNNIINTLGLRAGSSGGPTTQGWGIWNSQPTRFVIQAENNYMSGNQAGDYKGLTPISTADEPILNAGPDGGTNEDDPDDPVTPTPSTGVYIPTAGQILNTDFGYVQRAEDDYSAYINGIPFGLHRLAPAGGRVVSKSHSPQVVGSNLSDLGLEGSEVTLECFAPTMDDAYKVMAAFCKPGRSFIELGGAHKGYFLSGIMPDHGSSFDLVQGETGKEYLDFNINFETEFPYIESMKKTVRDHYIFGSCAISSDDIHDGNLVKNPNFSAWTFKDSLEWEAVEDAADNAWRNVKYAQELKQWCAVAESGTDNRIMVSGPNILSDLSGNNKHGLHTVPGVTPLEDGLAFDGTGFAEVPIPDIANATNFTVYCRFSTETTGAVQSIFGMGSSTGGNPIIMLGLNSSGAAVFQHRDDAGVIASATLSGSLADGLPHELCGVKAGTLYTLYIDGVQAAQVTQTVGTLTVDGATIGKLPRNSSVYPFTGTIYSTRIFSGALSAAQVPTAGGYTTGLLQAYSTVIDSNMYPPGKFWIIPPGLLRAANRNNNWRGLAWCPDWMTWVATSITGAGTACITSEDGGVTWLQKTTPGSNAWGNCIYIPVNDTLPNGRLIAFAQSGSGARTMYSDDKCTTWVEVAIPIDIANNNLLASAYSPSLNRIVIVSYGGSASKRVMYTDDFGLTYVSVASPAQKWTGVIWAEIMGLFIACSEDGTQQIMTSATGVDSWTLQTTPYAYSTVSEGTSTVVKTNGDITETGWNYTTLATSYTDKVNPMKVFTTFAPAAANHIRIDRIRARLRVVTTGPTAYLKVTAKTATIAETTLVEWTETATTYQQKGYECAFEGAAGEAVTLTYYLKTTSGSVRAGADNMGYTASEMTAGSSSITYYRNQWRDITYSQDLNLAVVVCQDTANVNYVMYSNTGTNWYQTESIARQGWVSVEYSDNQKAFIAVATSGTNRVQFSEGYGDLINLPPSLWTKVTDGEEASDLYTHDSDRSLLIRGDGVTENPGYIYQKLPFDSLYDAGELYIMLAYAHLEGLTHGSYHVDLYAGGTIIKELVWDADTEDTIPKEIRFRFDQIPSSVYIRVRGADTPNAGSLFYCGYTLVSKVSEYENEDVGAEIVTDGYYDCVPNVKIRGVGAKQSSGTSGRVIDDTDGEIYTTTSTTYQLIKTVRLPALTGGSVYQLNRVAFDFKTNNTGAYIYCKTTIQAASLFGGKETDISLYTTNLTTYQHRIYDLPWELLTATNEQVTFKWYIRISKAGSTGFATKLYQKFTEVINQAIASATPIYIYNNYDPRRVLQLCNGIPPGYMVEINKDSTGSIRYVEPFEDDRYLINAYDISGSVARDDTTQTILMSQNSYLIYKFDTLYAVAGIPFFKCYAVAGNPQISIAKDEGGTPGTFYPVDANTTQTLEKAEVVRQLDKQGTLSIRGLNKFYVKIAPLSGQTLTMGQMLIYASLDTIDAQRILIYVSQKPNSIGVLVEGEGKCSAILSLEYRKTQILP